MRETHLRLLAMSADGKMQTQRTSQAFAEDPDGLVASLMATRVLHANARFLIQGSRVFVEYLGFQHLLDCHPQLINNGPFTDTHWYQEPAGPGKVP